MKGLTSTPVLELLQTARFSQLAGILLRSLPFLSFSDIASFWDQPYQGVPKHPSLGDSPHHPLPPLTCWYSSGNLETAPQSRKRLQQIRAELNYLERLGYIESFKTKALSEPLIGKAPLRKGLVQSICKFSKSFETYYFSDRDLSAIGRVAAELERRRPRKARLIPAKLYFANGLTERLAEMACRDYRPYIEHELGNRKAIVPDWVKESLDAYNELLRQTFSIEPTDSEFSDVEGDGLTAVANGYVEAYSNLAHVYFRNFIFRPENPTAISGWTLIRYPLDAPDLIRDCVRAEYKKSTRDQSGPCAVIFAGALTPKEVERILERLHSRKSFTYFEIW